MLPIIQFIRPARFEGSSQSRFMGIDGGDSFSGDDIAIRINVAKPIRMPPPFKTAAGLAFPSVCAIDPVGLKLRFCAPETPGSSDSISWMQAISKRFSSRNAVDIALQDAQDSRCSST